MTWPLFEDYGFKSQAGYGQGELWFIKIIQTHITTQYTFEHKQSMRGQNNVAGFKNGVKALINVGDSQMNR